MNSGDEFRGRRGQDPSWSPVALGVLLSLLPVTATWGQRSDAPAETLRDDSAEAPQGSTDDTPSTLPSETDAPGDDDTDATSSHEAPLLPGPKYHVHRWNDDFSYLAGPPGSYRPDFFDPIKYIRLDDDWSLSLGGSHRGRVESRTNNFVNLADPSQDTRFLHRSFLHMDLKYRKLFRFYLEGIYAEIENNDLPLLPVEENRFDFYQGFVDVMPLGEETPLTFRAGRQELLYGAQRLISPLDWANTRRRFDGFKLFWSDDTWDADAFYVYPVPIDLAKDENRKLDHFDERQYLLGTYVTYKGIPRHGIDVYYFYYRNANGLTNADGNVGSLNLNTIGGRFWGRTGPWDYDTELVGQFGTFANDTVQAWAWALDGGHTFEDVPWKPRLGIGVDYASGDADPSDGKHQTFNQLFPLGHAYLGYIDFVARQNVWAGSVNLTVKPREDVTARLAYHAFWLAENSDGLYNAGGALVRRDPTGRSSHDVGQELDLTISWQIDVHSSILFGYSHFWNGDFINETGLGDDADFIYLQYEIKF